MTDYCAVEDCGRPVGDAFVCAHCAWTLKQALGSVAALEEDLPVVLARLSRYTDQPERVRVSATPPLPYHVGASEAAWVLANTLGTWVRLIAEEYGRQLPESDQPSLADMAEWLEPSVEWLRHHRAGHEAVEEILAAVALGWDVADRPSTRARFEVGPCPDCTDGMVWAHIPAEEDRPATVACPDCGASWASVQYLTLAKRIRRAEADRIRPYVSSATAALSLGVSVRTVQRWIVAGLLVNHGTPGRVLLDLEQIEMVEVPA